ncbi:hypothetical protein [Pedobacter xixiisoli]|uniref:Uncharacterized protein n=1 Tax=Pedobacter xixiisoli TaxID=1476464 RepID=A0A286A7A8_9SPHI|nr:hypothetical protein [Pedobacter xixiisoli]SOD17711.1 hypothetical protein SAMN06297358_2649 [Pedobacter xixiisoli]
MKENLTPDGVAAKIAAIYAMTTHNRLAEAAAVENSFKTWISDNFNLDANQTTYLSGIGSAAASNFGYNCGIAFRNMLQIALIIPTPRTPPTKWLKMTNNILIATDDNGAYEATGSLTFAYEYR